MVLSDLTRSGPVGHVPVSGGVRCRLIDEGDLGAIAALLTNGFPWRGHAYWAEAVRYLQERHVPDGYPRYGFMLADGDRAVGVLLLIFSQEGDGDASAVRCNVSSWYVRPEFQVLAPMLVLRALRYERVTYMNISPKENTLRTIEAQGFERFCDGVFAAMPALTPRPWRGRVIRVEDTSRLRDYLPAAEVRLLRDHAERGCLSMFVETRGDGQPFVFRRRVLRHGLGRPWLPIAQLIYTRDIEGMARFAGLIGRYLAARGMPLVLIGANRPVPGLPGLYHRGKSPLYYRGPKTPRLGDLAYTEAALFSD
jgi:hypothetical protein